MGVYICGSKLLIIIEPKTMRFDLATELNKKLKHEIEFIIKDNEMLLKQRIKNGISQLLSKHKHGNDIHGHRKQ